jgi:filamentous hemagglutinin family protein
MVRPVGLVRRTRSALLVSTALQAAAVLVLAMPADAQPAPNAQPMGGVVVGGAATISQTASNTTINQSSARGAVNWQSFNVGSQQAVTFQQPSAQAITLNTVTGSNPSQIAGRIDANGQIVLVNQSGVVFYKGSQVNTAGLAVSAAGANPAQFMAGGNVALNQAANPNAQIVNNGNITIKGAGLAALVAPSVANAGVINAKLGHVVLAGAPTAMLDLYGDKLVSVIVTGAVTQAPDGADALVTNTGVVRASGGTVQLTAKAVDGVVTNLVSAGGKIEANTVGVNQGRITIDGVGGSISITGNLSAQGKVAGAKGGHIGVLATDAVVVNSGAAVNASGAAGGGTVAIGTTLKRAQGGSAVTGAKMAKGVLVQQGATISADATATGNGGKVTVLSSQFTGMEGLISAKGGQGGGDGGLVEVSGGLVALTGLVNTAAPKGKVGTLQIDPLDLYISDTQPAAATYTVLPADLPTILANKAPDAATVSWVTPALLQLETTDVSLAATRSLFVTTSTGTTNTLDMKGYALTLTAGATLTIDSGFRIDARTVTLIANGATASGTVPAVFGNLTNSGIVNATAGDVVFNTPTLGAITNAGQVLAPAGNAQLIGGDVTQSGVVNAATVTVRGDNLTLSGTTTAQGGDVTVTAIVDPVFGTPSSITLNGGTISAAGGNVGMTASGSIAMTTSATISATQGFIGGGTFVGGGNVSLAAATGIAVTAATISAPGTLSLGSTAGGVNQDSLSKIVAGRLIATVSGTMSLLGTANAINQIGGGRLPTTAGTMAVIDNVPLTLVGTVSASSGNIFISTGANDLTFSSFSSLSAPGQTIGIQAAHVRNFGITDTSGGDFPPGQLTAGVLELAPPGPVGGTGTVVTIGTTGADLSLTNLTSISVGTLLLGAVTLPGGTKPTTFAAGITVAGTFDAQSTLFGVGSIARLELEANGAINQSPSAPILNLPTLIASTNGFPGDINLGHPSNTISTLDDVTAANGNVILAGAAASLSIPQGATIFGNNVTITNAGSIDISGSIGACAPTVGSLIVTATTGDLVIDSPALVGAQGSATLSAPFGNVTQTGGLINALGITIVTGSALSPLGGTFTQNGGTIAALDTAGIGVAISAAASFNQNAGAITSNSVFVIDSPTISVGGTIIGVGIGSFISQGGGAQPLTQNGGTIASGGSLFFNTPGINQLGGTIGVPGTLTVTLTNSNGAGMLGGDSIFVTIPGGSFPSFTGGALVTPGGTVVDCMCATGPGVPPTLPGVSFRLPSHIDVTYLGDATIDKPLAATWVSLHGVGASKLTETAAGAIIATFLSGDASGNVSLGSLAGALPVNQVGSLGNGDYRLSGSATFTLNDGIPLTIANTVSALSVGLKATSITIPGTVTAGTTGTVTLIATGGTISETGALIAGTLTGSSTGATTLTGAAPATNQIINLGAFTAGAGSIVVNDGTVLTVTGLVSATAGDVVVRSTGINGGVTIAAGFPLIARGTLAAAANTGTVSVRANNFSNNGSVFGGTLEVAPDTASPLTISGVPGGITVNMVRFGAARGSITATSITLASNLTLNNGGNPFALDLEANGPITDGGTGGNPGFALNVSTLTGVANGGLVSFTNTANAISAIGSFSATQGFALNDGTALVVTGPVTAGGSLSLTANGPMNVTGSVTAGGAVSLIANGALTLGGPVTGAGVNLTATGAISETDGVVNTGILTASGSSVSLNGANSVSTLGASSAGGGFLLNDGTALAVTGPVTAGGTVSLAAIGTLSLAGPVTGAGVGLTATSAISENGGAVNTAILAALGSLVSLNGANSVGTLGASSATSGGFTLADTVPLTVAGVLSGAPVVLAAPGIAVAGQITTGGGTTSSVTLTASVGTIDGAGTIITGTLSGSAAGTVNLTGPNQIGSVGSFSAAGFTLNDATTLTVANSVSAPAVSITATSIAIPGVVTDGGTGTVSLNATGGTITETGTLIAGTLSGSSTGATTLSGAGPTVNQVTTLGNFTAAGFTLNDGKSLSVAGMVSGGTSAAIVDSGPLLIGGTVTADAIGLTGANIAIPGAVTSVAPGTVSLIATGGGINEAGTLIAGTLTGSSTGTTTLTGANVTATNGIADLALAGMIGASAGTVNLTATGNVYEIGNGSVSARNASISAGTNPVIGTPNQVTNLGSFSTGTGFSLRDGEAVVVNGPINATTGGVTASAYGVAPTTGPAAIISFPGPNSVGTVIATAPGGVLFNPIIPFNDAVPTTPKLQTIDLLAGTVFSKTGGNGIGPTYQFGAFLLGSIFYPSDQDDLLLPLVSDLEY